MPTSELTSLLRIMAGADQAKYEAIIATDGTDSDVQMEIVADALRLPRWDAKIGALSGGEKRRVALCRLLLSKPDTLLLDEPRRFSFRLPSVSATR